VKVGRHVQHFNGFVLHTPCSSLFYCVKFRTVAKFQETSCHKCEGKTEKSCKVFARKAGPMVMKSPDLDNR
jgi:hypothetical protein